MTLTLEQLKKILNSEEDIIVTIDGETLTEIDEENGMFLLDCDELPISEGLEWVELYEYTELEFSLDNIYKAYKEEMKHPQERFQRKIVAMAEWNDILDDIEEEMIYNSCRRIDKIASLKQITKLKKEFQ
jgi:hypothetical protein